MAKKVTRPESLAKAYEQVYNAKLNTLASEVKERILKVSPKLIMEDKLTNEQRNFFREVAETAENLYENFKSETQKAEPKPAPDLK